MTPLYTDESITELVRRHNRLGMFESCHSRTANALREMSERYEKVLQEWRDELLSAVNSTDCEYRHLRAEIATLNANIAVLEAENRMLYDAARNIRRIPDYNLLSEGG